MLCQILCICLFTSISSCNYVVVSYFCMTFHNINKILKKHEYRYIICESKIVKNQLNKIMIKMRKKNIIKIEIDEIRKIRIEYKNKNHETIYKKQYKLLKKKTKTIQKEIKYKQQKTKIIKNYIKKFEIKFNNDVRVELKKKNKKNATKNEIDNKLISKTIIVIFDYVFFLLFAINWTFEIFEIEIQKKEKKLIQRNAFVRFENQKNINTHVINWRFYWNI